MKRSLVKYPLFLLALMLVYGCTEEVDPGKLGLKDQLLVVNSLISPEYDTLGVEVSWSRPLFGLLPEYNTDEDLVTNATVTLSDGVTTVTLVYNVEWKRYLVKAEELPIVEGKTYTLQVTSGTTTTTASCTIPVAVRLSSVGLSEGQDFEKRVTLSWEDPEGVENFYRVRASQRDEFGNLHNTAFFDEEEFTSDVNSDGSGISARGDIYLAGNARQINVLLGELISCDENYFLYFRNRRQFDEEDPFSEPNLTHSNIEGGTGIFAAFKATYFSREID